MSVEEVREPISGEQAGAVFVAGEDLARSPSDRHDLLIKEQGRLLLDLIEKCPFGIYLVDADFRIMSMNRRSQDGAFANVRPVIGRPFDEAMRILWPEDVAQEIIARFRHTLDTGEPFHSRDFVRPRSDIEQVEGYEWELHRTALPDGRFGVTCYYYDSTELREVQERLSESEQRLATELDGAIALQQISTRLIGEKDLPSLYREIVRAAMAIMRSDFGSIQRYDPERNELYLLGSENFHPQSAKFWEWVSCGEASACGKALEIGERIIVPKVDACEFMSGTEDLLHYLKCGIRAVQSTPLFSRSGESLGMISTHWRQPYEPSERDWRLFDVLARQAADLIERTQAEERRKLLVGELNHRVKNTLAIVQAVAQQTFRRTDVSEDILQSFEGRLEALAGAHDLLTKANWGSTNLKDIIIDALRTCGGGDRAQVEGPPLRLGSSTAVTFAMVLHELCTNALKYGALSDKSGRVSIHWSVDSADEPATFHFEWREHDGPAVEPPEREGFGTRLIERALVRELHSKVHLDYQPDGLRFTLDAPLPSQSGDLLDGEPPPGAA